jgi:hypothetical protein
MARTGQGIEIVEGWQDGLGGEAGELYFKTSPEVY